MDWAPLAAAAWALAFAAVSFYWGAGGEVGLETVGEEIERDALAREPDAIALVWLTGGLKVRGPTLALALRRPRGPAIVRRAVGLAGSIVGIGLVLYAVANFVQHGLMAAGAIETPDALGQSAVTWHLVLWDPVWLLGGVLFTAAAVALWACRYSSGTRCSCAQSEICSSAGMRALSKLSSRARASSRAGSTSRR